MRYHVGGGFGTVDTPEWKVVAWLSRGDAGAAPASGEWWGTATFRLRDCTDTGTCSGPCWCAGSDSVDVVIDQLAP